MFAWRNLHGTLQEQHTKLAIARFRHGYMVDVDIPVTESPSITPNRAFQRLRPAQPYSTLTAVNISGVRVNDSERLFAAVELGDAPAVERLLGENPDLIASTRGEHMTPLHEAARLGHREVVIALLDHGADLNAIDDRHSGTPLGWAVFYGHSETARMLLEHGANPHARDRYGNPPMYYTTGGAQGELEAWGPTAAPNDYRKCAAVLRQFGVES